MRTSFLLAISLIAIGWFPASSPAQSEITEMIQTLPGKPRQTPFTFFVAVLDQPPEGEGGIAQKPEMQHVEPVAPPPNPATVPSVLAEPSVGIGFLIAGVAGWILLTIAFLILAKRQPKA